MIFLVIALLFFFMAGTGLGLDTPRATAWGLFSLTLGILLSGIPLGVGR
jgi:hypothetical protein